MRIPPIVPVWRRLGGGELRNGRGRAFNRGGKGYNVSIDSYKDVWHDFVSGASGGVLDLVETMLQCDRRGALAWLEAESFIEARKPWSASEKLAFTIRREAAREAGKEVESWREGQITELESRSSQLFAETLTTKDRLSAACASRDLYWLNSLDPRGTVRMFVAARSANPEQVARLVQRGRERMKESRRLAAACVKVLATSEACHAV